MEDLSSARPAASLNAAQPPAARHVSPEAFLQAICIAWGHMQPAERKVIRKTCRSGRLLHDSLLTDLRIRLGGNPRNDANDSESDDEPAAGSSPTPVQLRGSLQGVVARGARLQSLAVTFNYARGEPREAQLLAALAACSGCPLTHLELHGAVPLSEEVAEAVHACCPQLASLCLDHRKYQWRLFRLTGSADLRPYQVEVPEPYRLGCARLFELCGPQLRELQLRRLYGWQASSYEALLHCTALTNLQLAAGWVSDLSTGLRHASPTVEADVMEVVSQLRTLRSLHLWIQPPRSCHAPDAVDANATCVGRLSALTALTHLHLVLPDCYTHHGYSWDKQQRDGRSHAALREAREAHRASMLFALGCMPQLQHLHCYTLWLQPSELAALSCLTSLTLAGLLPPAAELNPQHNGGPDRASGGHVVVPPNLRDLELLIGASPLALAPLSPLPPSLTHMKVPVMRLGTSDVDEEGRLTAETVAAVGPAVQLLAACCAPHILYIVANGSPGRLLPREGSPNGHMEWIRQLQGLEAFRSLLLFNIALRTGDICALGNTLPCLKDLDLRACSFPMATLPILRPAMRELHRLHVNFDAKAELDGEELVSVLVLLCRPHAGAESLMSLECSGLPPLLDLLAVEEAVLQQLASDFGGAHVDIRLSQAEYLEVSE